MLTSVHRGPPPSVTWADRNGWVLADAREPRRMRPHLRPARPAGHCQQRGPHPAARTAPALIASSPVLAAWRRCPARNRPSPSRAGRSAPSRWAELLVTRRHWRWRMAPAHPAPNADSALQRKRRQRYRARRGLSVLARWFVLAW